MVVLKVNGMMCAHCEMRITQGLNEAKIANKVDLANKTVELADENQVTAAQVILEEIGYSAVVA